MFGLTANPATQASGGIQCRIWMLFYYSLKDWRAKMPEVMCPICNSHVTITSNESQYIHIYNCPVCGRFEYYPLVSDFRSFPINKLKAFLAYNNYPCLPSEARYFSFRSKESCSKLKNLYESGNLSGGYPVHLDLVDVNNWYPDTFSQKNRPNSPMVRF